MLTKYNSRSDDDAFPEIFDVSLGTIDRQLMENKVVGAGETLVKLCKYMDTELRKVLDRLIRNMI